MVARPRDRESSRPLIRLARQNVEGNLPDRRLLVRLSGWWLDFTPKVRTRGSAADLANRAEDREETEACWPSVLRGRCLPRWPL